MVDDLSSAWRELRDMKRDIRKLKSSLRLESAAIDEGGLTVISDNPGLRVEGLLTVTGTFVLSGGATITGTLTVNGPWTLAGNGDITGNVDLTGDLNVAGSGRVKIGGMTLDPSTSGGGITFGSGRSIIAISGGIGVYNGSDSSLVLNTDGILVGPGSSFRAGSNPSISGMPTVPLASAGAGAFVGAVIADGSGNLRRVV